MIPSVLLSVEDDDAEYYILKTVLKELGIPIESCRAVNGEEALRFLKKSKGYERAPRPDLILLDMNLPKKSGFEVLVEMRKNESLRSIPVIIFTSAAVLDERDTALALGAADFISKPRNLKGLREALQSLCSRFLSQGGA